jgi:hypothetical protein
VSSSTELFDDIRRRNEEKSASICPRFVPAPPTDWTRVGYGGDGVDKRSGLYMDARGQYSTTYSVYYPQILYVPNKPPMRASLGDAEKSALSRRLRVECKKRQHEENVRRVQETYATAEYAAIMSDNVRVQHKTGQALQYLRQSFETDFFRADKTGVMQKRPNRKAADSMWGGSKDTQLGDIRRSREDQRTFESVYDADFKPWSVEQGQSQG